jgi:putative alpha-1,2-mannosidase
MSIKIDHLINEIEIPFPETAFEKTVDVPTKAAPIGPVQFSPYALLVRHCWFFKPSVRVLGGIAG